MTGAIPDSFRGLVAEKQGDEVKRGLTELSADELGEGEVTVRVSWSSVNYKDALAVSAKGRVARIDRLVPGIDLAGEVVASSSPDFGEGEEVLAHGHDIGVAHHGGFAEYARVPAGWVVPLPSGLTARRAMAVGTAGFTAGLSVTQLEARGLEAVQGPVLVLGATGGVGSIAVALLAARGYEVHASTGKADRADFLRGLGAVEVLAREDTVPGKRPLEKERWAACVDPVGGAALAFALSTLRYGGAVASSGMTGGTKLETTVLPFILRGVAVLGVDSVNAPTTIRRRVWEELGSALEPSVLDGLTSEVALEDLDQHLDEVLSGGSSGRTVVRIA
ncbi:MAG: acryloyl-CoA reductase [Solirubrobacterales bacterium]|nr:acryloyl-CoA reductase [Solirubrobacterales bacterium]